MRDHARCLPGSYRWRGTMFDEPEQTRRRHRALGDPSRARILAELTEESPLSVHELARRVALHANTVRVHLNALVEAGLVAGETESPRGRGRPRIAYSASPGDEPGGRRYRLLAEILTALVGRFGGAARAQLEEIGAAWGSYLLDAPPPFATLPEEQAITRVLDMLAEVGFRPRLESSERGERIVMRPCPFLELARQHQDVICPIHLGLLRGALAEAGAKMTAVRLDPFVEPDICIAQLARGGPTVGS